jgi:hypothetical protein
MRQIAEFAVLSCALFTDAAVHIKLVEHPARTQCGIELAATEFAPRDSNPRLQTFCSWGMTTRRIP